MPRLAIADLWKRLDQGTVDPFYLFFGPEAYLIREYTEALTSRVLGAAPREFNFDRYAMTDRDGLVDALGIARTLPVMASYRVVVVQELQELRKADWKLLESYVTAPSESTALIATSRDGEPKKFPDFVWKHATAVACALLDGSNLRGWVGKTVSEAGYRITDEALPRIPPLRGTLDLDIPYGGFTLSPQVEIAGRQADVFRGETETEGYSVVNLRASYVWPRPNMSHILSFTGYNLTNTLYRNHTSYIKDRAPEMGRGVRLGYAVRFH